MRSIGMSMREDAMTFRHSSSDSTSSESSGSDSPSSRERSSSPKSANQSPSESHEGKPSSDSRFPFAPSQTFTSAETPIPGCPERRRPRSDDGSSIILSSIQRSPSSASHGVLPPGSSSKPEERSRYGFPWRSSLRGSVASEERPSKNGSEKPRPLFGVSRSAQRSLRLGRSFPKSPLPSKPANLESVSSSALPRTSEICRPTEPRPAKLGFRKVIQSIAR